MPRSRGRTGRPFLRARARVLATFDHCCYCGDPVDTNLPGRDPMGPTYAHLTSLCEGGAELDPANADLAHLRCNTIAENKRRAAARRTHTASRPW